MGLISLNIDLTFLYSWFSSLIILDHVADLMNYGSEVGKIYIWSLIFEPNWWRNPVWNCPGRYIVDSVCKWIMIELVENVEDVGIWLHTPYTEEVLILVKEEKRWSIPGMEVFPHCQRIFRSTTSLLHTFLLYPFSLLASVRESSPKLINVKLDE